MKKSLAIITLLAGAASAFSQGQINWYDYAAGASGFKIQVYAPNALNTYESGATSSSVPSGSTVFSSQPIGFTGTGSGTTYNENVGADYTVELYAAAGNVTTFSLSTFSAIPSTEETLFSSSTGSLAGIWTAGVTTITLGGASGTAGAPTVAGSSAVSLAIACWYSGPGGASSLAAAESTPGVPFGVSPVGVESASTAPNTPPNLPGLGTTQDIAGGITSFNLQTIPEPSTIALGVIGASAFLMRLRRNRK